MSGSITFDGCNILAMSQRELTSLRGRHIAYVPQSAAASFNPAHPLLEQVIETSQIYRVMSVAEV
ncbi:hypothetical protein [Bradyrhizobium sp. 131]|uniref:hypothetical protein n=1 Tax=Bradyrhizobium sp. 131 TaxID=2782609 RepID=UPI002000281E|nr:hypothetical protein [Bradyrhizobium sp. 131]UPK20550.1 hypothetical protein IVA73_05800 [Bradyrhizobium sp. 131]